jgi:branched-chain amino acid transport system substrate-binding protein
MFRRNTSSSASAPALRLLTVIAAVALVCSLAQAEQEKAIRRQADVPVGADDTRIGDLYALVVGVSNYRHPDIKKLEFAHKDAADFAAALTRQTRLFKKINVKTLLNEDATKAAVEKELWYGLRQAGKGDTVILFFSGHGADDPFMPGHFCFLSYDSDPENLKPTAVDMTGLPFLKRLDAPRVALFADACHAGGFSPVATKSVTPSLTKLIGELRDSQGKVIITSSKEDEYSLEKPEFGNGLFTYYLLRGLEGEADTDRNGVVTLDELYSYVYDKTKDDSRGRQHPQLEGRRVGMFPLSVVGNLTPQATAALQPLRTDWSPLRASASVILRTTQPRVKVTIGSQTVGDTGDESILIVNDLEVGIPHNLSFSKDGFENRSVALVIPTSEAGKAYKFDTVALTERRLAALPPPPQPAIEQRAGAGVPLIGSLNDLTGATSDVGKDFALGIKECVTYINEHGGINGKKLGIQMHDYGYSIPEAIVLYKKFRDEKLINLLFQWGTGDTEALAPTINKDGVVSLSQSSSGHICDPRKTPYNFISSADLSTSARAALTYWYEEEWKKSPRWASARAAQKRPKLVCVYMFASPFAAAPIKAVKDQAKILGIEVGLDRDLSITALDAKSQVKAAKDDNPTVIWHGNPTMSAAAFIKDSASLNLNADHLVSRAACDKKLANMVGSAGQYVFGVTSASFPGEEAPMMREVMEYAQKVNGAVPSDKRTIWTVLAWQQVALAAEALKIADRSNDMSGPAVKKALESLRDWRPFGMPDALGTGPITITQQDHRPSGSVRIYRLDQGKFQFVTTLDVRNRFAGRWNDWLGF